jgi:hypothetical protein
MTLTRKNNNTIATFLTYAKRASVAYLIMPSFMFIVALNVQAADAQRVEFILQFGAPEEDESTTVANDVFTDSLGDVYVAGYTDGTLPGQTREGDGIDRDAFIIKYGSDGEEIWTRQFGTENSDVAHGVDGDSEGGVYVVGSTDGTLPGQTREGDDEGRNAFIIKYDSDGEEIWTRQFGTSDESDVVAIGVSTDSLGDVYVVGDTDGTLPGQTREGDDDVFLSKYSTDGEEIWTRQFGTSDTEFVAGVSTDSSGDGSVYVVGTTHGTLPGQTHEGGGTDAFIIKYDSDGEEIWTRQFGTSDTEFVAGVSTDSSGDAYVAGSTAGTFPSQTGEDGVFAAFIIKYDSDGEEIWTRQFEIGEGLLGRGVSVDSSGDSVYLAGIQVESAFIFVYKFSFDGDEIWTRHVGTPSSEDDVHGVSAHASSVYVVGETQGTFPGQTRVGQTDGFLAKFVDDDNDKRKHHDDDNDKRKHHDDDNDKRKHHDDDNDKRKKH